MIVSSKAVLDARQIHSGQGSAQFELKTIEKRRLSVHQSRAWLGTVASPVSMHDALMHAGCVQDEGARKFFS